MKIINFLLAGSMSLTAAELYGQSYPRSNMRNCYNRSNRYYQRRNGNQPVDDETKSYRFSSPYYAQSNRELTLAEKVRLDNCRRAILQDNPKLLEKAMGPDFEINLKDPKGETLLQFAVKERKRRCLFFLLERKAYVNCTDSFGLSPLFLCSRDNDAEFAEILINAGADTYHQDKTSHWNVFHKIAEENMGVDTLSVLVRRRRKNGINAKDRQGRTPLHLAVSRSPHVLPIVEMLLNSGADVNAVDNQGRTPLDVAKHEEIVSCLLDHHGRYNKKKRSRYSRNYKKR